MNMSALGMPSNASARPLFNVANYQTAIDWLRRETTLRDHDVRSAVIDAPAETWRFYDAQGDLIINVPHATVERVWDALRLRERLEDDAA